MPRLMGNPLYHWTHLELKRVFGIEIEDCARCGGTLRVVATSERPANRACG